MLNTIARSTTKLLRRNYTMKIKIRNKTTAIAAASNYNKETDLEYFEFKETDLEYSKVPYSQRIIKARYRTEEEEGKYAAQALREGGEVPGTLYGGPRFQYGNQIDTNKKVQTNDRRNVCVLNIVDLARDLRMHELSFFCLPFQLLKLKGKRKQSPVVPTGMQTHPNTMRIISNEFLRIEPEGYKHKPKVEIPIIYIDDDRCPNVLKMGGYLNQAKRSLTVRTRR